MSSNILITSESLPMILASDTSPSLSRFLEFFTANIRNANTRRAYFRASVEFLDWYGERGASPSMSRPSFKMQHPSLWALSGHSTEDASLMSLPHSCHSNDVQHFQ
nr:hypothetical protein [uncultured Cohaesibacter sp.]